MELCSAGSEVPVNQAAGTSRGAESRRARPTTCPGSPGKVGEARAPPGVPEWPREVAGRGWEVLSCSPARGWVPGMWGRDSAGVHGQEMAAPTQKGSGSRSSRPHRDRPTGEGSVPAGHGRQRRGERERVPAQTSWLVREQTCQSSGSMIKTA